ncbi:zinc finger protein 704 isoform X2 [Rhipicephalus sanguineus]|uniref:zinc finger protein 704 isoform X2 n=1 Tax=Rhipicephalus sanguineus TaxID=34632 RepID=UPI001892E4F0|nr:zinc finger protein 704 isoform X2 [Rhipicephalus sanguineus]
MSTGKRLAKRSILGTRVCAPTADGLHMPGVIQATKTDAEDENVYTVTFPDKTTGEYRGDELIGPGFQTIAGLTLKSGQRVYVTFNGREVSGAVLEHDAVRDDVLISIQPSQHNHHITHTVQLHKRLEEVRLLESRKSARLQDLDTDYSRLAEGQSELRRRASSLSIDVPPSINGRKRRPSASEDADTMDDCMAAMVLMRLSCSPKSPRVPSDAPGTPSWTSSSSGASSWASGRSPPRTGTPSPPAGLAADARTFWRMSPTQDEGVDFAENFGSSVESGCAKRKRVLYKCMWKECGERFSTCKDVERHVRVKHLGRGDESEDSASSDHEEEFYYTESEEDDDIESDSGSTLLGEHGECTHNVYTSAPTLSHLDMARPPHEDPQYQMLARVSPQKFMRLSPKTLSVSPKSSPLHRRVRSESRKCRKVHGMENKDMWCTQCKWKKACSRYVD